MKPKKLIQRRSYDNYFKIYLHCHKIYIKICLNPLLHDLYYDVASK